MTDKEKKMIDEKLKEHKDKLRDDMFIGFNEAGEEKTGERDRPADRFRTTVQRSSDSGFYTFSACPADNCW